MCLCNLSGKGSNLQSVAYIQYVQPDSAISKKSGCTQEVYATRLSLLPINHFGVNRRFVCCNKVFPYHCFHMRNSWQQWVKILQEEWSLMNLFLVGIVWVSYWKWIFFKGLDLVSYTCTFVQKYVYFFTNTCVTCMQIFLKVVLGYLSWLLHPTPNKREKKLQLDILPSAVLHSRHQALIVIWSEYWLWKCEYVCFRRFSVNILAHISMLETSL